MDENRSFRVMFFLDLPIRRSKKSRFDTVGCIQRLPPTIRCPPPPALPNRHPLALRAPAAAPRPRSQPIPARERPCSFSWLAKKSFCAARVLRGPNRTDCTGSRVAQSNSSAPKALACPPSIYIRTAPPPDTSSSQRERQRRHQKEPLRSYPAPPPQLQSHPCAASQRRSQAAAANPGPSPPPSRLHC